MYLHGILKTILDTQVSDSLEKQTSEIEETVDNTVNEMTTVIEGIKQFILEQGVSILLKILFVLIIYFVAKRIKKILVKIIRKTLERTTMEVSVAQFIVKLCESLFSIIILMAIVGYLGIDTSSLVALIGSAGLAVGLALQGSLSNFAGGVLILIMKPFKIGDYIVTSGVEGVVSGIDIFYTKLVTADNRTIVIPNGSLSNANIENVSALPYRRIDLSVPVEYNSNLAEVRNTLLEIAAECDTVIRDIPEHNPVVFVSEFEASDIAVGFRVWVETSNYWTTRWALMETIKNVFDEKNINIPFNQVEVNIISDSK